MKIKLGEALRYEQPTKYIVASEKYNDSYATPVLTAGKSFILGYTNEESGIYDNLPVIIFDDFTTDIKYVDFPFKVKSSAMKMLQPANENYNLKFFYYLIKYMNFQPTSHQRHWISKFAEMEFDIPERVKQDQIVEKLDKLVEMQSKKTTQLKKYDDLVKSQFIEMFGNVFTQKAVHTLGDYISDKTDKVKKDYLHENIKYVDISSIDNTQNEITSYTTYKTQDRPSRAQQIVEDGDIVISTVRPNLNNVAMIKDDFENIVASTGFCVLKKNMQVNEYFIFTLVKYSRFADYLSKLTTGASYPAVSNKSVLNFKIDMPPIELQNKFAEIVKHIDKLKFTLKEEIKKLQECYNSLMKEYFE